MIRRSNLFLPTLAFALLATGLAGCNRNEQDAETPAGEQAQTGTAEPGSPATPGSPAPAPGAAPGEQAQAAPPMDPNQLPAVVARVNGKEIKKEELVERAQGMRAQLAQTRGVQVPLSAAFYREILDGMIAHHLLLAEAEQKGITISDAEVERQLAQLKSQFPSQEVYQKQLAANKMTEADLKRQMRGDDNRVNKLIETTIVPTVQVSEADARAFYDQNQERMKTPPRAHVRHILLAVAPQAPAADRETARKKADDLLQQLENGGDFAQLAAQNSNDPGSAARGGDLSWVTPGQMVPAFEKATFALKQPNELSPVVETRFGYHIIQLIERQEGQTVPFEQAKNRIGALLQERKAQEAVRTHVQGLKSKAKIETFI